MNKNEVSRKESTNENVKWYVEGVSPIERREMVRAEPEESDSEHGGSGSEGAVVPEKKVPAFLL